MSDDLTRQIDARIRRFAEAMRHECNRESPRCNDVGAQAYGAIHTAATAGLKALDHAPIPDGNSGAFACKACGFVGVPSVAELHKEYCCGHEEPHCFNGWFPAIGGSAQRCPKCSPEQIMVCTCDALRGWDSKCPAHRIKPPLVTPFAEPAPTFNHGCLTALAAWLPTLGGKP